MKLERLLAIVMLLINRKRMSARALADHFEVSLRTIYRDVDALNAAGIPVISYAGAGGGYEIMDRFTIDRQILDLDELHTITAALQGVKASMDDKQLEGLLEKVKALIAGAGENTVPSTRELVFDLNPWGITETKRRKVSQLRDAIRNRVAVRISYTNLAGETRVRVVEPAALLLKGYIWYLHAYCRAREDYRLFRLSRIQELETNEGDYFKPHSVEIERLDWLEEWNSEGYIAVELYFSGRVEARIRDIFDSEQIIRDAQGYFWVKTEIQNDEWMFSMLLSFGEDLCIIKPNSLRERIKQTAQKLLDMYA